MKDTNFHLLLAMLIINISMKLYESKRMEHEKCLTLFFPTLTQPQWYFINQAVLELGIDLAIPK